MRPLIHPRAFAGAMLALSLALPAAAQKEIKIGVLYDLCGPFSRRRLGGSLPRQQNRDRHGQ